MSWKYSSSYAPRDHSASRNTTQLALSNPYSSPRGDGGQKGWTSGYSEPRYYRRNSVEPVEHSPVWAKTSICDNPASVQRLKERYNVSDEPQREAKKKETRRTETKEAPKSGRPYGRSLTTGIGEGSSELRRRRDRTPEVEKVTTRTSNYGLDSRKVLYMPTATAKSLTRKYSNDLSPTTLSALSGCRYPKAEVEEDTIVVVTRGTSPTPTASSVYLRTKRADFGLEKRIPKPRKKPEMFNKEVQTDKEEVSLSKYSMYCDNTPRTKWSFVDKYSTGSSYSSKLPRCSYESRRDQLTPHYTEKRSISREESDDPSTPDSPHRSLTARPPTLTKTTPISPVKEPDKKIPLRKSPPTSVRPIKLDLNKSEAGGLTSPGGLSPLQCKITKTEAVQTISNHIGNQAPKVMINPEISQTIEDVSSTSESSEEETTSEEEVDEQPISAAMSVKKSVTNFLQNIPNNLQNQSRPNLYQKLNSLYPQKFNFRKIESGERAWWLESTDKIPEGIIRIKSSLVVAKPEGDNKSANFLSPPTLANRQFSGEGWVKESPEEEAKADAIHPQGVQPRVGDVITDSGHSPGLPITNGDIFNGQNVQSFGKNNLQEESGEVNFDVTPNLRRREQFSKSPDNFLAEDSNHQMKFNQQGSDTLSEGRRYLGDFQRECSVKDLTQKLQNGLGSPLEDKNLLEPGDMTGMISKAKAGLARSKTKLDIKKSSSREMSPKVVDAKSEIDVYWKELADSVNRPLKLCDLDFTDLNSDDETDVFGNLKMNGEVPPPPPMLILPVPSKGSNVPALPMNGNHPGPRSAKAPAPPPVPQIVKNKKTVKLFWKEVKDDAGIHRKVPEGVALIWDELTTVKVDTQKLEYLFESRAKDLISKKQQEQNKNKEVIVLDPKRSNFINIGMTKLPPPRSIKAAILKMDSTVVNKEGIEKLLTMLPTEEERIRIQEAQNLNPDVPLGSAEQFLLTLASINELEARLSLWAFKLNFENSEKEICEPLMDLKQGMEILRGNKTFRGILSTLLSVGNFLNGYDVKGFQIEYLSKVPEVKDTVHKHSLLHHLTIIVMEKFPDSTDLYSEIGAVTRASKVDFDELAANIKKLEEECKLSWNYLKMIAKHEGHTAMKVKMSDFLADCAERIIVLGTVHKRIMSRFQKFAFWLGIPTNRISTTRPNEIFKIISEFALEYRTTRDRVLQQIKKINREKSRTRGFLSNENNDVIPRKMNSKEAKDDARLRELLGHETTYTENSNTWRRQRKDTKTLIMEPNNDDEEIIETLIKTANQIPSSRATLKERRRSRAYGKCCK